MALHLYEVGVRRHTTVMKLSDEDAKAFAERDGLEVKKLGAAKPAARVDVPAPSYAVDEDGGELPKDDGGVRRRGRQPRNKQA
ncbi:MULTISPECIES: hypothetical protein [Pseudonocardia]|uniref:Uncharacterized protein n=2 Tax=Pseudonocardia TaxID=1847 RepID=A0A1Y2N670_PSEAH|nr:MULTISPECIES: hypothetical protein [Pseudonocardia]OSY42956.1 hypothetical protein BG845_01198 [Pseudonocardia autotrophica]TDN77532.1 hypothetical protein C8E95_6780 [Pseudonocardia autotrophica]BBG01560.1 hypothetical protein Pdca_27690 [Pseudonocardia autotrophica]GEC29091.1 hypothetical protein PSA01_61200 [Pseudonocardia saturnea]